MPNSSYRVLQDLSVSEPKINIPNAPFARGWGKFFLCVLQSACKGIWNRPLPLASQDKVPVFAQEAKSEPGPGKDPGLDSLDPSRPPKGIALPPDLT